MPRAACNGIELEYDTFGSPDGRPLLLIQGLSAQMLLWYEEFCELLADRGHYVIRFDITALMGALPRVRFAAKRELFDEPALGAAMRALGMIPIDRDHPALARRALDEAAAKAGKRVSVVIFPEGTRAPAGQMLPFKGGAFVFAIQEQVPVVPVALHNTAQVMPAHGYLTIFGGRVVVEILDPIPTAGLTFEDRHRLKEQVHEALVASLRPEDGGVADRRDLGSFAGHAFGATVPT
jgi:1-acyl-sn-glycerol-3-phosphate acyltransferase